MLNKLLLSSLLILTLSDAKDSFSSERLLGIEVGYSSLESTSVIDSSNSNKGVDYGFRLGAQNEEWRTTLSVSLFSDEAKKYQRAMLSFDRFVWASLYKTDDIIFKPYLGGHIGYMKYTDDIGSLSDKGFVYGAQAGLAWNVLKEVDFDLAYRYSVADVPHIDSIDGFLFGVNYIY